MLAIAFKFHGGIFSATDPTLPGGGGEWPPHPCRAYSAIVAALHAKGVAEERERDVVVALERLGAPVILADGPDKVSDLPSRTLYVPHAVASKSGKEALHELWPSLRDRQPRIRNGKVPEHPVVVYHWPDADVPVGLSDVLRRVTRIGDGTMLAEAVVLDAIPSDLDKWEPVPGAVPDHASLAGLRVATDGRLDHLELTYQSGRRPDMSLPVAYRIPGKVVVSPLRQAAWSEEWAVWRVTGNFVYDQADAYALSKAFRKTMLNDIRKVLRLPVDAPIPASLSGHEEGGGRALVDRHPAVVPLPLVGNKHASGTVMGIAVIPHQEAEMADLLTLARAIRNQDGTLKSYVVDWPGVGRVTLAPVEDERRPHTLSPRRWARPSAVWGTVLPYRFEGMRKHGFGTPSGERETLSMVAKSCQRVGLPAPIAVDAAPVPRIIGTLDVHRYAYPERHGGDYPVSHLLLRFPVPVTGPLIIGADRHFGFGLCTPLFDAKGA
jgi:CRISPR-associated protein Csb2